MAYDNEAVIYQEESMDELEKELNFYRQELEAVDIKKQEAFSFSLKMGVVILLALVVAIVAELFIKANEWFHVPGTALIILSFVFVIYGSLMLIKRVPMIVSQPHIDTGRLMKTEDLKEEYAYIIREKENQLDAARAKETQMRLDAERRRIEEEAMRKASEKEFGAGESLKTGDSSGITSDDKLGLTISLEDALNELRNIEETEKEQG